MRLSLPAPSCVLFAASILAVTPPAEAAPEAKLVAGPLKAEGAFAVGKKVRRAASGIACKDGACLIVFDEGRAAYSAKLSLNAYVAEPTALTLRDGDSDKELDAEGAAIGDGSLFVVGSHAKKRTELLETDEDFADVAPDADGRRCKPNKHSVGLFRVAIDPATGLPAAGAKVEEPNGDGVLGVVRAETVGLGSSIGLCLGLGKGLNIEGLASKDDRLLFGLRGPTLKTGSAYVLSANAKALFAGADAAPRKQEITAGEGRAVRDMHVFDGAIFILVGPDDVPANDGKPIFVIFR